MRELSSNAACMQPVLYGTPRRASANCMYLILVYVFGLALRFGFGDFDFLQALACSPNTLCNHCDYSASSFSVIECLTGEAFSGLKFGVCHGLDNSCTTEHAV